MTKSKKIIIIVTIVLVVILGIIAGIHFSKNNSKKLYPKIQSSQSDNTNTIDKLTDVQKEIAGIDPDKTKTTEVNEKDYSESYKEFIKHTDENSSEVVPRKQNVPFEKLEEIKDLLDEEETKEEKKSDDETSKGELLDDETSDNETIDETTDENGIPKSFNLANKIDIKVEYQGSYGLCWDFASLKALETHLAIKGIGNYDLSEMHLDYIESNLMYGYRTLHEGGSFGEFENYIAESGVVLEEEVPYQEIPGDKYLDLVDLKKVTEVTETVVFPSIYKNEENKHTDEEMTEFRNTVKKHIMNNGGLYCVIAAPDYGTKYFNSSNSAQCFLGDWEDILPGRGLHAVTIVGWDDNYSRDNFNSGMRPTKDGAYIILNSWGTGYGNEGYYYVSYEDKYVESELSGIVSTSLDHAIKISDIKNPAIQNYLRNHFEHLFIKYEGEEYLTKSVISNIYSLDLSNSNMTSLDGIEMFKNTYDFNISNNHIKDLTPLTHLTNISSLDASNNEITDISALANMKTSFMYNINLSNNKIKDVSALNNVPTNYGLFLNISKNPGVTGYDKLDNIYILDISDCDVKDVSNLKNRTNLNELYLKNNVGVTNLSELPENIVYLDITNCGIDTLPTLHGKIIGLFIAKNNLKSLEGIQSYKYLNSIDISENPITNWSALKNIEIETPDYQFEEDIDFYSDGLYLRANGCNIEDITIFNDLNLPVNLYLRNNNIKDVSQFSNKNIEFIDLSNNKHITGLESLSEVDSVFLDNCNISDVNEILKLKNVGDLSLENNQLSDISDLSKLEFLTSLSLAGNKGIKGNLTSNKLNVLNVSDCDLDDNFDCSRLSNLEFLNILTNPNIKDVYKIFKNCQSEYLSAMIDTIDLEQFEKIKNYSSDKYYYINIESLYFNYEMTNNETQINLKEKKNLRKDLMKTMSNGHINVLNGHLNKNAYIIDVDDPTKDSVEIKYIDWTNGLNPDIRIILHPNEDTTLDDTSENVDNTTNTTNIIDDNTSNNTVNVVDNNVTNETTNETNTTENTIINTVDEDTTITNDTNITTEDTENVVNGI